MGIITDEYINKLIEEGNIDKALELQEQLYFYQQSKYIKDLILQMRLEEALDICDKFPTHELIQSQKVTILIKLNRLEEALEICDKFPTHEPIQSQKVTILMKLNRLEEALEICDKFPTQKTIQSQKVTILIKLNRLKEALEICDRFDDNKAIQSQKVTILIKLNRLKEALEICDRFDDNKAIQSQKVTILIKLNRLEEALEICDRYSDDPSIQSQKVTILIKLNRLEEALEICDRYSDDILIQSQKITILVKLNRLEEALEICDRYSDDISIQSQKKEIIINANKGYDISKIDISDLFLDEKNEQITIDVKELENIETTNNINSILLTRIYCNDILVDELEKQNIDEWDKIILLAAYYEKNNKKMGIKKLKEYKKNSNLPLEKTKHLNLILERMISNKITIFDITFYERYIRSNLDGNLAQEIFNKQNEIRQKEFIDNKIDIVTEKKQTEVLTEKVVQQKIIKDVLNNKQDTKKIKVVEDERKTNNIPKESKTNLSKNRDTNSSSILIKDIFKEEVLEIQLYLYVQMNNLKRQRDAVKAWDNFEEMIIRPVTDKEALNKMVQFLRKMENSNDVSIKLNEKKYTKYLNI